MRLFPAHLRDAKQMARALCDAFAQLGLPRDFRAPEAEPPSLQQTQEFMANAMGYAGWRELAHLVQQPHVPVYMDTMKAEDSSAALEKLTTALGRQVGVDYAHGHILNAIEIAGVGFSPKVRRSLAQSSTPWGVIVEEHEPIADGIRSVSTAGHGGWLLSPERQSKMPEHLRSSDAAYEEDGEFHLVALAFPGEQDAIGVPMLQALTYLDIVDRSHTDGLRSLKESSLSEIEVRVIDYLANCVRSNRIPIRFPGEANSQIKNVLYHARAAYPSKLEDWVQLLSSVPTIDGNWATRPGPWFDHWNWRTRSDLQDQAREIGEPDLFEANPQ